MNQSTTADTKKCEIVSEIQLQAKCFQWAWNELPQTRRLLFHVPNGGKRDKITASQLKASGVVPGVPDFLFIWKGKMHPIEMKIPGETTSPAQDDLHPVWEYHGFKVTILYSFESFKSLITLIIQS